MKKLIVTCTQETLADEFLFSLFFLTVQGQIDFASNLNSRLSESEYCYVTDKIPGDNRKSSHSDSFPLLINIDFFFAILISAVFWSTRSIF